MSRKSKHCFSSLFLTLAGLTCIPLAHAAALTDSDTDLCRRAQLQLPEAGRNWHTLFRHQAAYARCDDGLVAAGYSDAVVTLMADRWDLFGEFARLARGHPHFKQWVLGHIDASAAWGDLERASRHAASCAQPGGSRKLCSEVRRSTEAALAQSRSMAP